jgi:hypothetical protein
LAALNDTKGLAKLLAYAESIGLKYNPLTVDQIEQLANEPFEYETDTVVEHQVGEISGYYQKFPAGWGLVAVGPAQGFGTMRYRYYASLEKTEGWATRLEMQRAARSDVFKVGEIAANRAPDGTVRLAEVLKVDAQGYPTLVDYDGIQLDPQDVEGTFEKTPGTEEATKYLYFTEGKRAFAGYWAFSTMRGRRQQLMQEAKAAEVLKPPRAGVLTKEALAQADTEFLARVREREANRKRRVKK